ncbi:MAG TPA: DUF1533 domain-containing protein [Bacteroidales bacterium]|nr:DUF1533 domain-containing protein [Bacteroidales bacterium]
MKKLNFLKMTLLAIIMMVGSVGVMGQYSGTGTFKEITALNEIESGTYYVFYGINSTYNGAMTNTISSGRLGNTSVSFSGSDIVNPATSIVWKIVGDATNGYTIFNEVVSKYCEITTNSTSGFSLVDASTHTFTASLNGAKGFFFKSNHASAGSRGISIYQTNWRSYIASGAYTLKVYKLQAAAGTPSPALTAAVGATVDNAFDVTFTDDATWRAAITSIEVGGTALNASAYSVTAGKITFTPSVDALLRSAGTKSIVVKATGYADAFVSQDIAAGAATKLTITTQPAAPAVNGTALATQPVVEIQDQYGNKTASTADVAAAVGAGAWTLGGTATQTATAGTATFTDLTATSTGAVTGATITFTSGTLTSATSVAFDIPAPVPALSINPTSLTGFSYMAGAGPSDEKSFTVSGVNLTADITITAPASYEISKTTGASFVSESPIILTQAGGTVAETTIYVRLKAGLAAGSYNENITLASGTLNETLSLTGKVKDKSVVISQVYGGGGNSGALYKSDFIELYNPTSADVVLTGWSVQYNSATGTGDYQVTELTGTIKAGHYYLIKQADGSGGTKDLPTPDVTGTITMGASNMRVALVQETTALSGNNDATLDANVVDFVGTGSAKHYEGSDAAPAASNTNAVIRKDFGATDTDNNNNDFVAGAPTPRNSNYRFANSTETFQSGAAGNWSESATWEVITDGGTTWYKIGNDAVPSNMSYGITVKHNVIDDVDVTVNFLTIDATGELTIATDKELSVNSTFTNNGNIIVQSGATLLTSSDNNVAGNITVEQLVNKPQTYYIGSPVGGTVTTTNIGDAITFTESNNQWSSPVAFANPVVGKGYGVQVGKNESPGTTTISFTGTELNSGNKNVILTIGDRKFNFLGNPYPSYLDGAEVVASANLEKTIWLFFKGESGYQFKYRNVGVPGGEGSLDDAYIAPMQGFWVRVAPEVTSNFTYTFINGMRTHKGTSTTVFRAPQVSEKQELRLALSNGTVSDEAILLFSENANNDWNSSKMMNPGLNIYTVKGSESLALNSRTAIEYDVETAVGVKAESGVYTFSASKFENFGAEKAYLLDKVANVATDLSSGDYTVNFAEAYDGTDRFALVFPRSGVVTGLENAEAAGFFAFANNNRISVNSDAQSGMIYVFNSVGQQVATQAISGKLTTVSTALPAGVYMVKVNNLTTKVVVR